MVFYMVQETERRDLQYKYIFLDSWRLDEKMDFIDGEKCVWSTRERSRERERAKRDRESVCGREKETSFVSNFLL